MRYASFVFNQQRIIMEICKWYKNANARFKLNNLIGACFVTRATWQIDPTRSQSLTPVKLSKANHVGCVRVDGNSMNVSHVCVTWCDRQNKIQRQQQEQCLETGKKRRVIDEHWVGWWVRDNNTNRYLYNFNTNSNVLSPPIYGPYGEKGSNGTAHSTQSIPFATTNNGH